MRPLSPFRIPSILKKKFRGCFVAAEYTFVGTGRSCIEHTYKLVVATNEFKNLNEHQQLRTVKVALKEKMIWEKRELDRLDIKTCSTSNKLSDLIFGTKSNLPSSCTFPLGVIRIMGRRPNDD